VLVRDSLGIRIVEHAAIPDGLPVWSFGDVPSLRIGVLDGPEPGVSGQEGFGARALVFGPDGVFEENVMAFIGGGHIFSYALSRGSCSLLEDLAA
jgi:hypothetical protein